jgi:hypothetical protein
LIVAIAAVVVTFDLGFLGHQTRRRRLGVGGEDNRGDGSRLNLFGSRRLRALQSHSLEVVEAPRFL